MTANSRVRRETTIGIVTALSAEFDAMSTQIDNLRKLGGSTKDRLTYYAGRIGPHRVVLIRLLRAGVATAARECATLLERFPQIRLLLMVGTAAGVNVDETRPRIELGDIVVSAKGVVEHDHYDRFPGRIQHRGPLRESSSVLRRHAEAIAADDAQAWHDRIADAQRHHPDKYARPAGEIPSTAVHHGRIASGNVAFSDQEAIADVAKLHDCIAVDMETTGVAEAAADGCGWMAVRGISDFGDEQRNKVWRNYASLAAAAHAHVLLKKCPAFEIKPKPVWPWVVGGAATIAAAIVAYLGLTGGDSDPLHVGDQMVVAGGTGVAPDRTVKLTLTNQPSWRRYLDLTVAVKNPSSLGDCEPADLKLVVITDGHTRPGLPLARSKRPVTVDIGGVRRTVLVEVTVAMPDKTCRVDVSVADAVLHD